MTQFADRLILARDKRDLNQTELAKRAGLHPSAISHFESNRRKPSFDNLRSLAEALAISADYLLGLTPEMNGSSNIFEGEDNLTAADREMVEMMIALFDSRKEGEIYDINIKLIKEAP